MEIIDLEMIPGGPKKTCHASQFDNGRVIRFNLKENGQPFALSGTETVQAIIRKPDGSETTLDIANTSSTYVDLITEADTCDLAGVNHCEMKVTEDGEDLGSGNFDMKVEEDAYGAGDVSVGTASGPIASFETDIKDDLIECVCDINPVQDLHGYDHPWPGGGGKNKLPLDANIIKNYNGGYSAWTNNEYTTNGITFKIIEDTDNGVTKIMASGTASADTVFRICYGTPYLVINNSITVIIQNTSRGGLKYDGTWVDVMPTPLTIENVTNIEEFWVRISNGATLNNANITPMICLSTTVDYTYEPYSNVCPIEGHTEMDIIRSGVNLFDEDNLVIANYPYPSMTFDKATFLKAGVYMASISNIKNATSWRFGYRFFDKGGNIIKNAITTGLASFESGMQFSDAYDSNQTCLQAAETTGTTVKVTITKDCYFVACITSGDVGASTSLDYQIEKGSTASAYHPAEIIEKNIQLGQTVYRARINITTGEMTVTWGSVDLGTLNFGEWGSTDEVTQYYTNSIDSLIKDYAQGLATIYDYSSPKTKWSFFVSNGGGKVYFRTPKEYYTDATAFKTAMAGVLFIFELANPVSIQLTPEQIETLLGQKNNVYHNANGDTAVKFYTRA